MYMLQRVNTLVDLVVMFCFFCVITADAFENGAVVPSQTAQPPSKKAKTNSPQNTHHSSTLPMSALGDSTLYYALPTTQGSSQSFVLLKPVQGKNLKKISVFAPKPILGKEMADFLHPVSEKCQRKRFCTSSNKKT